MPYVRERCVAGRTIEIRKYYTPRINVKGEKRIKKIHPTPEAMEKVNLRKAERDLRRLMNHNFDKTARNVTLTFRKDNQPSLEELQEAVTKFIRKLRSIERKKNKNEKNTKKVQSALKYIYVLGAGPMRRHIHILIQGLTAEEIEGAWTEGHVNSTKVYSDNLSQLAAYYIKNSEDTRKTFQKNGLKIPRRWNASRNLKKPKPTKKIIAANKYKTEPRAQKGYRIDKDSIFEGISLFTGLPFFEYTMIREGPE